MNNETDVINRVQELISNRLPVICGQNCPMLCCDPVVAICFLSKNLFDESDNFEKVTTRLQQHIDSFVNIKTSTGKECFSFRHIYVDDIKGEFAGLTEEQIKSGILDIAKKPLPEKQLNEMVAKSKAYLRESQLAIVMGFQCSHFDFENSLCTVYNERPGICVEFTCHQLQNKFRKSQKKELLEYLTIKKNQRETLKNGNADIIEAIKLYNTHSKQSN